MKIEHESYINSEAWLDVRKEVLERDGWACVDCGAPAEEVHHETYDYFGECDMREVCTCVSLCRSCHVRRHAPMEIRRSNMEGNIEQHFPSRFLKAEDIENETKVTIEKVTEEEIAREKRLVVHFSELDKGVVLNKTNAYSIAKIVGSKELRDWEGQVVVIFKTPVPYKGDVVDAIRFKAPA